MRRITRYVIAEFLKVFVVTLIVFSSTMIVGFVLVEAIREGLAPLSVMRLLPYAMPMSLIYAIPGTTLFAACAIYGRMSAGNELTARHRSCSAGEATGARRATRRGRVG